LVNRVIYIPHTIQVPSVGRLTRMKRKEHGTQETGAEIFAPAVVVQCTGTTCTGTTGTGTVRQFTVPYSEHSLLVTHSYGSTVR
jgi:hypothetical protein